MMAEERAEKLLKGMHSIDLKVTWNRMPDGPMVPAVTVLGYIEVLRDQIAAGILEAVAEEREACARVAEASIGRAGGNAASDFEAARIASTIRARGQS